MAITPAGWPLASVNKEICIPVLNHFFKTLDRNKYYKVLKTLFLKFFIQTLHLQIKAKKLK